MWQNGPSWWYVQKGGVTLNIVPVILKTRDNKYQQNVNISMVDLEVYIYLDPILKKNNRSVTFAESRNDHNITYEFKLLKPIFFFFFFLLSIKTWVTSLSAVCVCKLLKWETRWEDDTNNTNKNTQVEVRVLNFTWGNVISGSKY